MSLVSHIEIIEQDEKKIQPNLLNKLKELDNWRFNKNDNIQDQCNYYRTYMGNEKNEKNFIDGKLLSSFLKDNEKYKTNQKHYQYNFLDIFFHDNLTNNFDLFYFNSENNNIQIVNLNINYESINEEKISNINLIDINEGNLNIDSDLIDMKFYNENLILCDNYSIYYYRHNDDFSKMNITKKQTLTEIPNFFLSDLYLDTFFILSKDENKTRLSLLNYDSFSILTQIYFDDKYNGGIFFNTQDLILLYQKSHIKLCDFREPLNLKNSILFNNNSFNINDMIYVDNFNYITISPEKISLFDLRYPTLPISDIILNINYSQIQKKKILNDENDENSYILFDKSRNDQSNLKIKLKPELNQLMDNFLEYNLVKNDKIELDIHDTCGYIDNNEIYYNFIVDNYNGVYLNVYNFDDFNYNKETISEMKEDIIKKESNDKIENKTFFNNLNSLYKTFSDNLIYKSINKTNHNNDFINSDNEDDDDKVNFGTVIVGGKKKRMYQINNQRKLIEKLVLNKQISDEEKGLTTDSISIINTSKNNKNNSNRVSISSENSENELGYDINDKNILDEEKIDFLIKELNLEEKKSLDNNDEKI
jgi:hypothetical protein